MGAARLKGYSPTEIIGKHFSIFYPKESRDRQWPERELELALERGRFEDEGWRVRKDGTRFWANVIITSMVDTSGRHLGFSKVTRDLTERREHEEKLRQSEERFRLMVESVRDYAIFMLNPDGTVATWNDGAERIKGYAAHEIIGRHFSEFYPDEMRERRWPEHELEMAKREGRFVDEGWRVRKDGTRFWANVVITALRDGAGELRGFAKVTRDLTDQRRIQLLEETEKQNTEFLAMLAHELRNPLAPILNALSLMRMSASPDPEITWSRDVIERQAKHLTRLVDDLLDVSRLTSGKIRMRHEAVSMDRLIVEAVETSQLMFRTRQQSLEVEVRTRGLIVMGDETRLHQVLLNLLTNASKYSGEGTRATLTADREGNDVVITLRDEGIGIAPDLIGRVFDLFVQAERTPARSEGGLGIGLTLVRQLTRLHGGTVQVRSEGIGKGSEFTVRLPLASGPAQAAVESASRGETGIAHPEHRVLIVDDNRDSADSLSRIASMWGYPARALYSGTDVIRAIEQWKPATVFLDIGLPGKDGYEVMAGLRDRGLLPGDVTVVAMTGYAGEEDRERIREAGFTHHFVKPIDLGKVQTLLERPL